MFGMIQRGQELRLALEAREAIGIGGEQVGEDLDRDVAIQFPVAGAIHLPHPALAKLGENVIRPNGGSNIEGHSASPQGGEPPSQWRNKFRPTRASWPIPA